MTGNSSTTAWRGVDDFLWKPAPEVYQQSSCTFLSVYRYNIIAIFSIMKRLFWKLSKNPKVSPSSPFMFFPPDTARVRVFFFLFPVCTGQAIHSMLRILDAFSHQCCVCVGKKDKSDHLLFIKWPIWPEDQRFQYENKPKKKKREKRIRREFPAAQGIIVIIPFKRPAAYVTPVSVSWIWVIYFFICTLTGLLFYRVIVQNKHDSKVGFKRRRRFHKHSVILRLNLLTDAAVKKSVLFNTVFQWCLSSLTGLQSGLRMKRSVSL